jgi:hypothetical protein
MRLLFDRESDPFELVNLIDHPRYSNTAEEMEQLLKRWLVETEDPFDSGARLPETEMLALGQQLTNPSWENVPYVEDVYE